MRKPKRPQKPGVSMQREVYEKLKSEGKKRGVSMPVLLEEILEGAPQLKGDNGHHMRRSPILPG